MRTFAQTTLDKVFLLTDHTKALRFTRTGNDLLAGGARSDRVAGDAGANTIGIEILESRAQIDIAIRANGG